MPSNRAEAGQRAQQTEYQDCILCRLTGTAVFGMLSLGAFKEAWRLHREAGQGGPMPTATPTPSAPATAGVAATIARLVKAMEVFPAAETSADASAAARPPQAKPAAAPAPKATLRNVQGRPTARVAFLILAGIGFGGGAVWRAVMPANKPTGSPQAGGENQTQSQRG